MKWIISVVVALVTVTVLTLFFHATLGRSSNITVGFWGTVAFFVTLFVTSLKKGSRKYVVWLAAIVIATLALVWLWLQGGYRLGSAALGPSSLQSSQGITFRSPEFRFRFVYPANWVEKTPRGANVRALIDAPDGASNCNIVVRRMPELARLSQKEIDAEAFAGPMSEADWKELLGSKFPDVKMRERRLAKIDNQLAHFAVNEMSYTAVAGSIYAVQMQVATMTPGLFWNFGCVSGGQNSQTADLTFQKMRPTFTAILSSLVLER